MKRTSLIAWTLVALGAGLVVGHVAWPLRSPGDRRVPRRQPVGATLLEGLGDYDFPITTRVPEVQRWFDQGLMLTYGFNHDAAERSYSWARNSIPSARCAGGARRSCSARTSTRAMDPANNATAWKRLQKAPSRWRPRPRQREQAFIRALSARYAENPPEDRKPLDAAYVEATRKLVAAAARTISTPPRSTPRR